MYEEQLTKTDRGGSFGIRSILEDHSGKFWICNSRYRFSMKTKAAAPSEAATIDYTREPGINRLQTPDGDDHIFYQSIVEDDQHALWMATYRFGVWKYDGKLATHFPVRDGAKEVSIISIAKDNHGGLWLGTQEAGPYKFNGEEFVKFQP